MVALKSYLETRDLPLMLTVLHILNMLFIYGPEKTRTRSLTVDWLMSKINAPNKLAQPRINYVFMREVLVISS